MQDDMDATRRAARLGAARTFALLCTALAACFLIAPRASALAPFEAPAFQEARLIGDLVTPPDLLVNSPRAQLLEPGQLVTGVYLTAGAYRFRFFLPSTGDTLGDDGTPRAVPGGPYATTLSTDPSAVIRIQVATADWYVIRLDTETRQWSAEPKPSIPSLLVRAFAGVPASSGEDSTVTRKVTVRWLRDREAEARTDFGGYRIYRQYTERDTANMDLVRRFAIDDTLLWHFPASQEVLQFVDPDSSGNLVKVCRIINDRGQCDSPGDSVYALVPPPGPHDGFAAYYTVTLGSIDQTLRETSDMFVPDSLDNYARCNVPGDPTSCPNLNGKYQNLIEQPVFVSGPATANVEGVYVVPNPYRGSERWDEPGDARVQFFNLPERVTVRVFTIAGDLVRELEHADPLSGNLSWNLKNAEGQDIASGIYLFHVVSEQGFEQKGHFVVIR